MEASQEFQIPFSVCARLWLSEEICSISSKEFPCWCPKFGRNKGLCHIWLKRSQAYDQLGSRDMKTSNKFTKTMSEKQGGEGGGRCSKLFRIFSARKNRK